jgi:hypothetical protein
VGKGGVTQTMSAGSGKPGARVDPERYQMVREAILRCLPPKDAPGMTWAELAKVIAPMLPDRLFRHVGTVRWYTRAVQLDLEAGGEIEQVPGSKPPRLRSMA